MFFWLFTLVRDVFLWRRRQTLERQSKIAGHALAHFVEHGTPGDHLFEPVLRVRGSYLLSAFVLIGTALYVLIGSALNYVRVGGYVEDIAWVLTLAVIVSLLLGFLGGVAASVWFRWPGPPSQLAPILRTSAFTREPGVSLEGKPRWELTAAALLTPFAALVLTLFVITSRSVVESVDVPVARWLDSVSWLEALRFLDPLGSTPVAFFLLAVVGIATLRCRLLFLAYPVAVLIGLLANVAGEEILERPRPPEGAVIGLEDSFPSGHVIQSVLIAGLFPLAVALILANPKIVRPLRAVLLLGTLGGALHRVHEGLHWPSDVLAGVLIGLSIVIAVDWILAHRGWHRPCRSCVWDPDTEGRSLVGVISLPHWTERTIRWVAHGVAAAAVIALTVLTLTQSVPSNPNGSLVGEAIQVPVQLGLVGIVSIGALLSWKWESVGAVIIAIGAAGLGVFSGLEYRPWIAILMTGSLLVPAVLLWLAWQHDRVWGEIVILAVVTTLLLVGTWTGASALHTHYFGPAHPESQLAALDVDLVEWAWAGALSSDGVTVVAKVDTSDQVSLRLETADGDVVETAAVAPDVDGIVRLVAEGLAPSSEYSWSVVGPGGADQARGAGRVQTPSNGPQSFVVAVGSCARVGSNGAVFDAIAATDPFLYLALGDVHYSNLASSDPDAFLNAFEILLTRPAQAALYRNAPVAYVWDDHDYGPNDSDASSPSRDAARSAYRTAVPHYEMTPSGPIQQAFTIGRVRFVLTDSRSERTAETMLGQEQRDWLIDEIVESSRTHALVVWGNPIPWIGDTSDGWGAYPAERQLIADAIADAEVDNLIMVSGDAHMVALDDGTNSGYAEDGFPGFPVLHAAALDRPGSVKGGPYSHGAYPGPGQFGTLDIVDNGDSVEVTMSGWTWEGTLLVSESFTFSG
jgi:membrane-associated phospholipid phosphatase